MNSMTGYGSGRAQGEGYDVLVELSAVNRRTLEVGVSIPREWQSLERPIVEKLRSGICRGRLHAQVQVIPVDPAQSIEWDDDQVEAALQRLRQMAHKHHVLFNPNLEILLKLATMNSNTNPVDPGPLQGVADEAVAVALESLNTMRRREGETIRRDFLARHGELCRAVQQTRSTSAGTVEHYRETLLARRRQAGLELELEDERVLKEIAIFADRCDISEELTRLDSHLEQLAELLGEDSEGGVGAPPVGRKLEFLVQEIHREFNTIGSKANNVETSKWVLHGKNELERIREQVQNIE